MRHSLFGDVGCDCFLMVYLFAIGGVGDLNFIFVGCESICVNRSLWNKAIREGNSYNRRNDSGPAK
jgi:hypothetical protein